MRFPSTKKVDKFNWHLWFAWYPVYSEELGEWIWLETCYRRKQDMPIVNGDGMPEHDWEYV